ncbi:hypothetical protein AB7X32_22580 [Morganella morganii]|uniref:hypothetical protein n=1 Tax=Morganella morganii TaxID=582 RepID=UPI0034E4084E
MKFEELPENIQLIAATALADILKSNVPEKELAEVYANSVKTAFIKMYEES